MKWFWGFILILVGFIVLGLNLGWLGYTDLNKLWAYWPLLLIIFGIALFIKQWKWGWLVILASIWAAILFVYNTVYSPNPVINMKTDQQNNIKTSTFSADLPNDVTKANIKIDTGAVNLAMAGSDTKLISGSLESNISSADLSINQSNQDISARLKTPHGQWQGIGKLKNNLDVALTNKIPLDLEINSGASSLNLDLTKMILSGLDINAGASSMNIKLGPEIENNSSIQIDAGASSIDIGVPTGVGVKVTTSSAMSSKDFNGFSQISNNVYQNSIYSTAVKNITIDINAAVSSIKIKNI